MLFYHKCVLGSSISIINYFIENAPQSDHQFANLRLQIDETLQPFQVYQDSLEKTLIQAKTFQIKSQYLRKLCHTLPHTKLACANTLYCLFRFYKQIANLNLFCFNELISFDISTANINQNIIAFVKNPKVINPRTHSNSTW